MQTFCPPWGRAGRRVTIPFEPRPRVGQSSALMSSQRSPSPVTAPLLAVIVQLMQRNLLAVIAGVYLLAGLFPAGGVAIKHVSVGKLGLFGERPVELSLTNLLLASMLFTAGLGVSFREVRRTLSMPHLLAIGVLANAVMPVIFLAAIAGLSQLWPETDEAQSMLAGLALIGAMPIAGGASVWTQNANGNVPLTVGLVLGSTLLSPLSIPLALHAASRLTLGDYAEDLTEVAGDGTLTFSLLSVVVPCFAGIAVRQLAGEARILRRTGVVKIVNLLVLLVLSYTNASGAMVNIIQAPDYDMLALMFLMTASMCLASFYAGYRLARALGAGEPEVTSMTFGVGMNNSSASSVLAASRLADHPLVLIPILAYGMLQKLLAGLVDSALRRRARTP